MCGGGERGFSWEVDNFCESGFGEKNGSQKWSANKIRLKMIVFVWKLMIFVLFVCKAAVLQYRGGWRSIFPTVRGIWHIKIGIATLYAFLEMIFKLLSKLVKKLTQDIYHWLIYLVKFSLSQFIFKIMYFSSKRLK